MKNIISKIRKYLGSLVVDPDEAEIRKIIQRNTGFVLSLDERQRDYLTSLTTSWRKEIVRLEKRVYELEQK